MRNLIVTAAAAGTVVTLAAAKANSRIVGTDEDTFVTTLLALAQNVIEERTDRAFQEQKLLLTMSEWPEDGIITLPRPPLVTVDSIKYLDETGTEVEVSASDYKVDEVGYPGTIYRIDTDWPVTLAHPQAIRITYTAGGGTGVVVPLPAIQAITLLAANWYENRESVVIGSTPIDLPYAVEALINLARWHG